MKYLLAAGCSFVEGGSMNYEHPSINCPPWKEQMELRFSKVLANKLNFKEINIAGSGGSNQRSIRLIYEWFKENKSKAENTTVVLGLTELLRKEKFSTKTQSYIKWRNTIFFDDVLNFDNLEEQPQKLMPSSFEFHKLIEKENLLSRLKQYAMIDVMYFTDIEYELKKLSQNLELLDSFIKNLGGNLIVFSAMLENDNLDTSGLNFYKFKKGFSWRQYIESYDKKYAFSLHPNVKDNAIIAEDLFNFIKNE